MDKPGCAVPEMVLESFSPVVIEHQQKEKVSVLPDLASVCCCWDRDRFVWKICGL